GEGLRQRLRRLRRAGPRVVGPAPTDQTGRAGSGADASVAVSDRGAPWPFADLSGSVAHLDEGQQTPELASVCGAHLSMLPYRLRSASRSIVSACSCVWDRMASGSPEKRWTAVSPSPSTMTARHVVPGSCSSCPAGPPAPEAATAASTSIISHVVRAIISTARQEMTGPGGTLSRRC